MAVAKIAGEISPRDTFVLYAGTALPAIQHPMAAESQPMRSQAQHIIRFNDHST